jgi:hypothetical protein
MLGKPQHIINNMLVSLPPGMQQQHGGDTDIGSKTLNLHQVTRLYTSTAC